MNWTRRLARIAVWMCGLILASTANAQNSNVTVDDQPTAEQRVAEVRELREAGRAEQAVELIQELVEGSRFKLVGVGEGSYADLERWCRLQLFNDPVLRNAHRARYTAAAEREFNNAITSGRSIAALQEVYRRFPVTDPGMQAGLTVVGFLLESGEALSSTSILDELMQHPSRAAHMGRLLDLRGAAAIYTGDDDVVLDAIEQLQAMDLTKQADALAKLRTRVAGAPGMVRPALIDAGAKPLSLDNVLWKHPIYGYDDAQTWVVRDVFTLPAVTPSMAMINNGRQVVAFDRSSGQRTWVYPADDHPNVARGPVRQQRWRDARSVAFGAGGVCAVLGECFGINDPRNPYVTQNRLAFIDTQTGRVKWERIAGSLFDHEPTQDQDRRDGRVNLRYTHFVGTPVITRGKVLALLRRTTSGNAQQNWLLCFDAADGTLQWFRHLAILGSTGGRDALMTTPQVAVYGETAYLTDGIATVASLDIQSGGYHWLRVLPVGYGASKRLNIKTRGVFSPPVLTRAGLLINLSLIREPMILLDPEDGAVLQAFDQHPTLNDARYVTDAKGGAVIVSRDSVAYWSEKDAELAWSFTLGVNETTVGRGDVTASYVVMPTNQRVLVLDLETGELVDEAELTGAARATNLVARDGELFVVHNRQLSLVATWDHVFQRLVQRVQDAPADPSGGMALASLALKQEGLEQQVLQGIGYALEAIEYSPQHRREPIREIVFNQMRQLTALASASELRTAMYDSLARVSQTPRQETLYHLDTALHYAAMDRPQRAIEHFQAVLAEPGFAIQVYDTGEDVTPAGRFAEQHIAELVERYGPSLYARYDAQAQVWLSEARAQGTPDAKTLINIARRYPLSLDAVDVMIEAAGLHDRQGNLLDAMSLYQQAVLRSADQATRQHAVGGLLALYLKHTRQSDAFELIAREVRRDSSLHPIDPSSGEAMSLEAWHQRAARQPSGRAVMPSLGHAIGQPTYLPGRLVESVHDSAAPLGSTALLDRVYLYDDDGALHCYAASDLATPCWSVSVEHKQADPPVTLRLVDDGPTQALFWSPDQKAFWAFDAHMGDLQWQYRFDSSVFSDLVPLDRLGLQTVQPTEELLFAASSTVVTLGVRDSAAVYAIDRANGTLLWNTQLSMGQLTAVACDQWSFFAAGSAGLVNNSRTGRVERRDLFTGQSQATDTRQAVNLMPRQLRLDRGKLYVVGTFAVAELDEVSCRTRWLSRFPRPLLGASALVDGQICVADSEHAIYTLDAEGQRTQLTRLPQSAELKEAVLLLQSQGDALFVAGAQGLHCFESRGAKRWQSAPLSSPWALRRLLVGPSSVALLTEDKQPDGVASGQSLSLYDRNGGRQVAQYSLVDFGDKIDSSRAVAVGAALLIPADDRTLLLPSQPHQAD